MKEMVETPIKSGDRVGNYILKKEIGKGAFSQVWKAVHHERPNRVVAVKIATEPSFRRHLSREGRLPEIDHPNVVPILDSDTRFADTPYIVMPYLSGGSLRELIAKHPDGLSEERAEALLEDILSGLAAAHTQGIIHRDIKPSNVLLDKDGRAMIADFGLSLSHAGPDAVRSVLQSASLSQDQSTIAGTLAYMAPEVLEGEAATSAADIYSVGVLLFEMLTGRRPAGLEFPSEVREELGESDYWDEIYREACQPKANRSEDAETLLCWIEESFVDSDEDEESEGEEEEEEEDQDTSQQTPEELLEEIKEKVIKIISEQMGVDKSDVNMETSFVNDLNADSLDTVELMMEFEDEFELSIPDKDAEKIRTVGKAVEFIGKAQAEKKE